MIKHFFENSGEPVGNPTDSLRNVQKHGEEMPDFVEQCTDKEQRNDHEKQIRQELVRPDVFGGEEDFPENFPNLRLFMDDVDPERGGGKEFDEPQDGAVSDVQIHKEHEQTDRRGNHGDRIVL